MNNVKENMNMEINGFELVNGAKVERAIEAVGDKDTDAILVEYDKLGGLIRHEGAKVVNGAFYDRKNGVAIKDPKPKVIKRQAAVIEEEVDMDDDEVEEVKVAKVTQPKKKASKKSK